jgi:hypothetical protein
MIDLEDELRELYADTDYVHDAAERIRATLAKPARRRPVGRTIAAAVTVAACVAGAAVAIGWHERATTRAGASPTTCTAELPAAWRRALNAATPITIDGAPAAPIMFTSAGDVIVGWTTRTGVARIGVTGADGTTRTLLPALGKHLGGGYALEGDTLVVSPTRWGTSMGVIDVRTGTAHKVSLKPAMPHGYLSSDRVAIQDGVVYFGASPRRDGIGGVIIGYDLARGTSHVVARTAGPVFVRQDARGVVWAAGQIRAAGTPTVVPGPRAVHDVYGDGSDYAWNVNWHKNHEISWTGGDGTTKTFTVRAPDHPSGVPIALAVSGPYVLLAPYSGSRPFRNERTDPTQFSVLDTRTGAVAGLGVEMVDVSAAGLPTMLAFTNQDDATLRIDTARLPELRC